MSDRLDYHELVEGRIPPWVMRFIKSVGKTINEYGMVKAGDEVLLAVSGGKDSLALALALSLRLKEYFSTLSIDFTIQQAPQFPPSFDGDFNCYLCSRNRRRILFEEADRRGVKLIAMGHHLDDLVETSLMNLCFRADFNSMRPVQDFFNGKMHIIRPMIEVHESVTRRLSEVYNLPTVKPVCPYDQTNIRARLKPIVGQLCHIDGLTREHIYKAHHFDCALK